MSEVKVRKDGDVIHRFEAATKQFFVMAEIVIYVLVGLAFLAGALGMLGYSVVSFVQTYEAQGIPTAVLTLINDLLLVMIIMEVLRTIVSYLEEQGTSLKPFLIIAAISATRRVLAIGAQMSISSDALTPAKFNEATTDLVINAAAILVIAAALFLLDRSRSVSTTKVSGPAESHLPLEP